MRKRLVKKRADWRYDCKRPMKIGRVLKRCSPYIGAYEVRGRLPYCPLCKSCFISYTLGIREEEVQMRRASELLLKNYPPGRYEYLSEEEVFRRERKRKYDHIYDDDESLLKYLRYVIFNIILEDRRIYLKKSFDLHQHNRTGWFDITKPEEETGK